MTTARRANRSRKSKRTRFIEEITCPHCWHVFPLADMVWVARHNELKGDSVIVDENAFMRFQPSRFNAKCEALDARGQACHEIACPKCHLTIPRIFLEVEPMFFSIIGGPASGKSNFLAAMTWELRRLLPGSFCLVFNDADTSSNFILNGYEETLFMQDDLDSLVAIEKTELASDLYDVVNLEEQTVRLPRPFLFTLRPVGKHPNAEKAVEFSRVLCLYDNAGEHFLPGQDTTLAPGTRHMAFSRMLMFLYDPTQMPRFRTRCREVSNDPQLTTSRSTVQQATIMTEAGLRIRQYADMSSTEKWKRPVLVLVSKADVWGPLIEEDLSTDPYVQTRTPSEEMLAVDASKVERVSQQVRALLMELTPEFVGAAEDFSEHVVYIPVSALGYSPEPLPDGAGGLGIRPKHLKPIWATVPFLYAFARWSSGLVGGTTHT